MSTQSKPATGRFVWHELMTTDVPAALKFYQELFGWKTEEGAMPEGAYHHISIGDRQFGGITKVMGPGQPAAWNAYVTVDSVDGAAERAKRMGGKVLVSPMDIPNTGRFCMLMDPQGAVLSPFTYGGAPGKPESDGPAPAGQFAWNELMTTDPKAALSFYGEVFGWSMGEWGSMGEEGTYYLFKRGEQGVAGCMQKPAELAAPPHWLYYIACADVDATFAKATQLGAKGMQPPMSIPKVGRIAVLCDPTGGVVGLYQGE